MNKPLGTLEPWLRRWADDLRSPVLECGTAPPGKRTVNCRLACPDHLEWVGTDFLPGPAVDLLADLEDGLPVPYAKYFGGCVCMEVLEHTYRPWLVFENLQDVLSSGSRIIITTLFHWEKHGCPDDYWRFTDDCLRRLMEDAGFTDIVTDMVFSEKRHTPLDPPEHRGKPGWTVPHHTWATGLAS